MLFRMETLRRIVAGEVTLAFRRWKRPTVKAGTRLRTALGVVAIRAVDEVSPGAIDEAAARRAGFKDRAALLEALGGREGALYRVELAHAGSDTRIALRESAPSAPDIAGILARLARFDRQGAWTEGALRAIAARPATRAAALAEALGFTTLAFKTRVRRLKELGLTESLEVGYRLSPRGEAVLAALGGG